MTGKRVRDEEWEEFQEFKKFQKSKIKPEIAHGVRTSSELLEEFNNILEDILHEDGFQLEASTTDKVRVFKGCVQYPNVMNLELQERLLAVEGVERISYEAEKAGNMVIKISWTNDKAVKLMFAIEDQREASVQRQQHSNVTGTSDGDLMYDSLRSFLQIDSSSIPVKCNKKQVSDEIIIVEVVVGVKSPLKDHAIKKVATDQSKKLHSIEWSVHQSLCALFLIAEIFNNPTQNTDGVEESS